MPRLIVSLRMRILVNRKPSHVILSEPKARPPAISRSCRRRLLVARQTANERTLIMYERTLQAKRLILLCALAIAGCVKAVEAPTASNEAPVREAVTALQMALKDRDAAKIWDLLDKDS